MSTPVSSSNPYISVADFLKRYDARTICQLCHDDDDAPTNLVDCVADLTNTSGDAYANLTACLADASGELERSVFAGSRYAPADLAAMTGNALSGLKRLVADVALFFCYMRRPRTDMTVPVQTQKAMEEIQRIADGGEIFGLQEAMDAGHITMTVDTPQNVVNRNSLVDRLRPFFGLTNKRLPPTGNFGRFDR